MKYTKKELEAPDTDLPIKEVSEKEAWEEVKKAVDKTNYEKQAKRFAAEMREATPRKRWRMAYDWLMATNEEARLDVEAVIKECDELRATRKKYARADGLRWGMRIPSIVMETIMLVDPRIREIETMNADESRRLYRLMEREFPQFKIPRQD